METNEVRHKLNPKNMNGPCILLSLTKSHRILFFGEIHPPPFLNYSRDQRGCLLYLRSGSSKTVNKNLECFICHVY